MIGRKRAVEEVFHFKMEVIFPTGGNGVRRPFRLNAYALFIQSKSAPHPG